MYRVLLSIAFVVVNAFTAVAQQGRLFSRYQEVNYQTEQGLPHNEVRAFAQTPDGFTWLSTRAGLARFDGIHFTVFRSKDNPGLAHDDLGAIMTDHLGRLWIATINGLSCYEHGRFTRYGRKDGLPSEAVHVMFEDHTGTIWFGTWAGLAAFDGKIFRVYTTKDGLPADVILALTEDQSGAIWIGTDDGLAYLKNGHFRVFTTRDGLSSNVIDTLLGDHRGRLWVGTEQGFSRLTNQNRFESVKELPGSPWTLYEDHGGNVWASSTVSLARLAPGESKFQEEPTAPGEIALTIFQDRDGSIWLGTTHNGAICYRQRPFATFTRRDGLANDKPLNFFQDRHGSLWIGTASGISRWSKGKMQSIRAGPSIKIGEVHAIAEDHEDRIWVGTSNGLLRFDGKTWVKIQARPIPLPLDIAALSVDRKDQVWVGGSEGLAIWRDGRVRHLTVHDGLPGPYIAAITQDGNRVWVATDGGLAEIENGKVRSAYTVANGLLSNFVPYISKDYDRTLWLCTPNGLHRFKNGHLQSLTQHDGLPLDDVLGVLDDRTGHLWIASYSGLFRVNKGDLERLFDGARFRLAYDFWGPQDGFSLNLSNPPNQSVMWRTADGTLWFATTFGVVALKPSDLGKHQPPPWPLLESLAADGEPITGSVVQAGVRRLELAFTAPTSISPERLEFRYRLDGFDREWHEAGQQRLASFTNLPKGKYRFRVSVRRTGGSWNPSEATVAFQILPHWYETALFRISCAAFAVFALWFAHAQRLWRTKRRLSLVLQERSRVANELHDTLLQSLSGAAMQVRAGIGHLKRGSVGATEERLAAALEQMERSQSDARYAIWELTSTESNGDRLTKLLHSQAKEICGEKTHLSYSIGGDLSKLNQNLEEQVYRICLEAVANAVRHSGAREVAVDLTVRTYCMDLCIRDNGCGFDIEPRAYPNGSHFGLRSMEQRAQRCGGKLNIVSLKGKGTRVHLHVPLTRRGGDRS